jgi:hypothetical protein
LEKKYGEYKIKMFESSESIAEIKDEDEIVDILVE